MATPRKATPRKPAKKPQDHAAKAEARGEDVKLEYDGHIYVISRENADDVELFEQIEKDHVLTALRGFIGDEAWAFWKDTHRGPNGKVSMTVEFDSFMNAILAAIGGGPSESPNSEASPTS